MTVTENHQPKQFNFQRLSSIFMASVAIYFSAIVVYLMTSGEQRLGGMAIGLGACLLLTLAMNVAFRRGRVQTAVYLFVGTTAMVCLVTVLTLSTSFGLIIMLSAYIVCWQIAELMLRRELVLPVTIVMLFTGISTVVIDLYPPFHRATLPLLDILFGVSTFAAFAYLFKLLRRRFQTYRFGRKLVTLTATLTFILLTIATAVGTFFASNIFLDGLGQNISRNATLSSIVLQDLLLEEQKTLDVIVDDPILQTFAFEANSLPENSGFIEANEAAVTLRLYREQLEDFNELLLLDEQGNVLGATTLPEALFSQDESWWPQAEALQQGQVLITTPELAGANEELFSTLVMPIDIRENRMGYIQAVIHLNAILNQNSLQLQFAEVDYVFENGLLNLHEDELEYVSLSASDLLLLEAVEGAADGYALEIFEGEAAVIAVASVGNGQDGLVFENETPWRIVAHEDQEIALSPLNELRRLIILIGIILASVGIGLSLFVGRLLADPLQELAEAARAVADGDFSTTIAADSRDEIGQLRTQFNQMTVRLQNLLQGLEIEVSKQTQLLEIGALVGRQLATTLDEETLIKMVVDELQKAFGYDFVTLFLVRENGRFLELVSSSHEPETDRLWPIDEGNLGRVAQAQTPLMLANDAVQSAWVSEATQTQLMLPLIIDRQLIGIIDVQQRDAQTLSEEHLSILQSVINQFVVALESARLYKTLEQKAQLERKLNQVNSKIVSTYDEAASVQVAIRETGMLLDAPWLEAVLQSTNPDEATKEQSA